MDLTLAAVLTASGAVVAAAIVRQATELIKRALPFIDARISGATLSFALTAGLYVAAFVSVSEHTPEAAFAALLSWLSCATSAIGINATLDHRASLGAKAAANDPVPEG